jgi:hypothetical protein
VFSFCSKLFLQRLSRTTRALASAGVGLRALTTHGQATTVAHATVTANVHQALDVHRGFAAQITFDGETANRVTQLFQITVVKVFDLFGGCDGASVTDLASARRADAKNRCQANPRVFVGGNVDTSNTCHGVPLSVQSALTLLMAGIRADHAHNTVAADDFTVAAQFFDRS